MFLAEGKKATFLNEINAMLINDKEALLMIWCLLYHLLDTLSLPTCHHARKKRYAMQSNNGQYERSFKRSYIHLQGVPGPAMLYSSKTNNHSRMHSHMLKIWNDSNVPEFA